MESFFEEYPARRAALGHAVVTAVLAAAGMLGAGSLLLFALAVLGIGANLGLGVFVHNRVSPAYSDGHPLVNMPPDGVTQS